MYRFIMFNYVSSFHILVIAFIIIPCTGFTCIHDDVTLLKAPVTYTRSTKKYYEIRAERMKNGSYFEALKLHYYINEMDPTVSLNVLHNVKMALNNAIEYIAQTFKVRKRKKPFVLDRRGCSQTWQSGANRGKCSNYKPEVEVCGAKDVSFQIPDRFLDKLEVFDFEHETPRRSFPSGIGLFESNFILFVTSQSTSVCEGADIYAYGTFCRLDPRTNEPLAGIINLCPHYFAGKTYPENHYNNIILHEIFHILGFSTMLFEKYLPCEKGIHCDMPRNAIQEDDNGIYRMKFPLVIEKTQEHFNCHNSSFGAPMAQHENSTKEDRLAAYSSHWNPLLMYGSIMTPKFSENDHLFVDKITLAAFASTGWYRVDFSKAGVWKFGKEQGCNFGIDAESCNSSIYLCNPSVHTNGCDLMHETIGKCESIVNNLPCGIYQPNFAEKCETDAQKQFGLDFYSLDFKQKCFMSENHEFEPQCLPIKCEEDSYSVQINMTWYACRKDDMVIVNNAELRCPDNSLFCEGFQIKTQEFCAADNSFCTSPSNTIHLLQWQLLCTFCLMLFTFWNLII